MNRNYRRVEKPVKPIKYAQNPGDLAIMFPPPTETIPYDDGLGIPFDGPYKKGPLAPEVKRETYQKPTRTRDQGEEAEDFRAVIQMMADELAELRAENSRLRTLLIRRES